MAEQDGLLAGLNNLPVFEGVPDAERSRAILAAGLQMLQPRNPVTQGGGLAATGDGISAGLASLDSQAAVRSAADQQAFDNTIASRGATTDEQRAAATTTTANAAQQNADAATTNANTSAARQEQEVKQFADQETNRAADADLKAAEAEWLRRRHDGTPAGASATAVIQQKIADITAENIRTNPARYTRADGTINQALARVDAYGQLNLDELVKNPSLAIIVQNIKEGQSTREAVSGLVTQFSGEDEVAADAVLENPTQEQYDALPAGSKYKIGDVTYTKKGE